MHKPHDVRPFALHRVVFMGTWIKKENDKMKKAISILGSTGSIGTQSLEVARSHEMQIYALAANRNVDALEQQAREFLPKKVCIFETEKYAELKQRLAAGVWQICQYRCSAVWRGYVTLHQIKMQIFSSILW